MTYTIKADSADYGLYRILDDFKNGQEGDADNWVTRNSRVGPTLEYNGVAVIENTNPNMYVSQCPIRKANPFFHLAEAMWMLAGRNDLDFLLTFNSSFINYSDDQKTVRGSAYGARWRWWFEADQLEKLVQELYNTETRRAVVTQWDPAELNMDSKDVPCNLQTLFLIRNGKLDMTVTNRSNDLVYGMYGSNIVHFSILHQYIAALLNIPVGVYRQVSNCLHIYLENDVVKRLLASDAELPKAIPEVSVARTRAEAVLLTEMLQKFFTAFDLARTENSRPNSLQLAYQSVNDEYYGTSPFISMFLAMMEAWACYKLLHTSGMMSISNPLEVLEPYSSGFPEAAKKMLKRNM